MDTKAPFEKYLDIEILKREDGFARLFMPYKKEFTNPYGILHGGAILSLADTTMAQAMYSRYPATKFYTVKLCINFKAPVDSDGVFAEARIKDKRKNFVYGQIVIQDKTNKLIAEAEATFFLEQQ